MHINLWTEILNLRSVIGRSDLFPTMQAGNREGSALSVPFSPQFSPLLSQAEKHEWRNTLSRTNTTILHFPPKPMAPSNPDNIKFFPTIYTRHENIPNSKAPVPARWDAAQDMRSCTGAHQVYEAPTLFTINTYHGWIWRIVGHLLFFLQYAMRSKKGSMSTLAATAVVCSILKAILLLPEFNLGFCRVLRLVAAEPSLNP